MPKISVIMPSLNVAAYIQACMDSVIMQTFQDIEIICIDAGSTDGTLEILNKYMEQDPRVHVLQSGRKSYGYQVNIGIAQAKGDYIGIVDTDDEIVCDMYEVLYRAAVESGADYVKGTAKGFYTLADGERYCFTISPFDLNRYGEGIELEPENMPESLVDDNFLWNGLYRSGLFKQVRLQETAGAAFQDIGALFQAQMMAKKAVYIKKTVYYYRQDNMGASSYNAKSFRYVADEYGYAEKFLYQLPVNWHAFFYRKFFYHVMNRMYAMAASGEFWKGTAPDMLAVSGKLRRKSAEGILAEKDFTEGQWEDLQLFWKNPVLLYEKYEKEFEPGKAALKQVKAQLGADKGIIFGSGSFGKFLHAQFLYRGYKNIAAYCDNDQKLQGKFQYGIEVLAPEQVCKKYPNAKYIIANKNHTEEIKGQLLAMGIQERNLTAYAYGRDMRLFGISLD